MPSDSMFAGANRQQTDIIGCLPAGRNLIFVPWLFHLPPAPGGFSHWMKIDKSAAFVIPC
jgi:hypothetical protein